MQEHERRRYFRINETVGITYHVLEGDDANNAPAEHAPDILGLVSKQDQRIEKLLLEIADENPKVAELVTVFNQKLERVVSQLVMESRLMGRIARRVREANLSACGVAFQNDESIQEGARLKMELTLYPSESSMILHGIVVGCQKDETDGWYWRIDFYGMTESLQEALIQHVVKSQSQQIKSFKGN